MSERPTTDLSPLHFAARYAEMKATVAVLDAMLLQINQSVEREQTFIQTAVQQLCSPMAQITARVQGRGKSSSR